MDSIGPRWVGALARVTPAIVVLGLGALTGCHDDEAIVGPDVRDTAGDVSVPDGGDAARAADAPPDLSPSDAQGICFDDNASDWTPVASLDTSRCQSRALVACESTGTSLSDVLRSQLLQFAINRCQLRKYTYIQVGFVDGCPSGLRLKDAVPRPIPDDLRTCLVGALQGQRWDCAIGLSCATAEWDTLP